VFMAQRINRFGWRRGLQVWHSAAGEEITRIEFYERLLKALEKRGIKRAFYQTPLEFAAVVGGSEARAITNAYNRVRFGDRSLSLPEQKRIEEMLLRLERTREDM